MPFWNRTVPGNVKCKTIVFFSKIFAREPNNIVTRTRFSMLAVGTVCDAGYFTVACVQLSSVSPADARWISFSTRWESDFVERKRKNWPMGIFRCRVNGKFEANSVYGKPAFVFWASLCSLSAFAKQKYDCLAVYGKLGFSYRRNHIVVGRL